MDFNESMQCKISNGIPDIDEETLSSHPIISGNLAYLIDENLVDEKETGHFDDFKTK